jgi:tRNA(adenine34) deaminase
MTLSTSVFSGAMEVALSEARAALAHGDVPVGAVVVRDGEIIARRHNERELTNDPTAHAEVLALRDASQVLGRWRLDDCTLVVTLEPCVMCAGALLSSRIGKLVYGAADLKAGATASLYNVTSDPRLNHNPPVEHGVMATESAQLLQDFFAGLRNGSA